MSRPDDNEQREVRERLAALRVDPADEGFTAALHRRLAAAGAPDPMKPSPWWRPGRPLRWAWPLAGVAAGTAAAFVAIATVREARAPVASPPVVAAVAVPATRVALVRLNLSSEVAVASAELRVSLPPGLVFWSEGAALAQRTFEWNQPLAAGANEIPIAVRGERPGRYTVQVTARIGGTVVEHEVPLEVTAG